jgi:hypothetical protein
VFEFELKYISEEKKIYEEKLSNSKWLIKFSSDKKSHISRNKKTFFLRLILFFRDHQEFIESSFAVASPSPCIEISLFEANLK